MASVCRKTSIVIRKWVFSVARSAGFASCKTFGKHPKHPCFGRSPKAGRRDASPRILPPARMPGVYAQGLCTMQSQPSIHSLSRGKGGRGIGIINQKFISKTDFFYNLKPRHPPWLFPAHPLKTTSFFQPHYHLHPSAMDFL